MLTAEQLQAIRQVVASGGVKISYTKDQINDFAEKLYQAIKSGSAFPTRGAFDNAQQQAILDAINSVMFPPAPPEDANKPAYETLSSNTAKVLAPVLDTLSGVDGTPEEKKRIFNNWLQR